MNKYWDSKYLKIALYTLLVICISIFTYRASSNTDNILPHLYSGFKSFINIFTPILYGLLIAYLMNPIMSFFEKYLIKWSKPQLPHHFKRIRILCIIIVYLCLFSTLFFSIKFLVPEIFENLKILATNAPLYINACKNAIIQLEETIAANINFPEVQTIIKQVLDPTVISSFFNVSNISSLIDSIISSAMSFTGIILDLVIGFVIAIYALMQKETFVNGSKRLTYAVLKQSIAQKIIDFTGEAHHTITKFFVGKSLDSLIIGVMCFIGLSLFGNPYALLLALIVGISNMIPYFGPFIGAIPAVALTLFEGFIPALIVGIFILFLQQFDGLYLGPKILGDSIGITPFWIISAITIGGALWGPLGMFFASPILAVILSTINKWVDRKLSHKAIELPKLSPDEIIPTPIKSTPSITLFKSKHKK
ncbi:MAG: AI-2E family transporter [Cellulosilyticaceae bacterium]